MSWKKEWWLSWAEKYNRQIQRDWGPNFIYRLAGLEDAIKSVITVYLLSSEPSHGVPQSSLRLAIAILMHIKGFMPDAPLSTKPKNKVRREDGFLTLYTDSCSRQRFLRIVDALIETALSICDIRAWWTIVHVRSFDVQNVDWMSTQWRTDMRDTKEAKCGLSLDWALTTAVRTSDMSTVETILRSEREGDECVILTDAVAPSDSSLVKDEESSYPRQISPRENALAAAVSKRNCRLITLFIHQMNRDLTVSDQRDAFKHAFKVALYQGSLEMVDLLLDPSHGLACPKAWATQDIVRLVQCPCTRNGLRLCEDRLIILRKLLSLPDSTIYRHQRSKNELLGRACIWGCLPLVRGLVEEVGAQPADFREKPLTCAAMHGHVEVMEYLLTRDTRHRSLFFSVYQVRCLEKAADLDMMQYLRRWRTDILIQGPLEPFRLEYLLVAAKSKGCHRVVDLLTRGGVKDIAGSIGRDISA